MHAVRRVKEMEIPIVISILTWLPQKKLNSLPRSTILRYFQNQEYWYIILKPWTRLAEKREEEQQHRELQSYMRFMQK